MRIVVVWLWSVGFKKIRKLLEGMPDREWKQLVESLKTQLDVVRLLSLTHTFCYSFLDFPKSV